MGSRLVGAPKPLRSHLPWHSTPRGVSWFQKQLPAGRVPHPELGPEFLRWPPADSWGLHALSPHLGGVLSSLLPSFAPPWMTSPAPQLSSTARERPFCLGMSPGHMPGLRGHQAASRTKLFTCRWLCASCKVICRLQWKAKKHRLLSYVASKSPHNCHK